MSEASSQDRNAAIPPDFWTAMGAAMTAREWPTIPILDFPLGSVRVNSWLIGMIDGSQKSVDGAMGDLFAASHVLHFPNYRFLVVAYQTITKTEIEVLLKKYLGTRMDKQVIVGVIHRESGQFFPPKWPASLGHSYPFYDGVAGNAVQDALREVVGPHAA